MTVLGEAVMRVLLAYIDQKEMRWNVGYKE
jgi:hypothetical protein